MLFFVIHLLGQQLHVSVPAVFIYFSTRMALAAVTSLLFCIMLGPLFIRTLYAWKIGQQIRKGEAPLLGELHRKKENTPTMGGLLVISSLVLSLLLWMDLTSSFTLLLFATTLFLGALGAWDDLLKLKRKSSRGLSARTKLILQLLFGFTVVLYLLVPHLAESLHHGSWFSTPQARTPASEGGETLALYQYMRLLYVPFVKEPLCICGGLGLALLLLFGMILVAGMSNAVNLTDGLDGLAVGSLIMVAAPLALIAFLSNHVGFADYLNILYIEGSGEVAIFLSAFVGACLGFIWYNGHPAQLFLGDTGSLSLGGLVGVSAILLKRELLLLLIGGVFVAEALSVILQVGSYRLRNKKRIFLCAPLHHHFEYKGWPETKVVMRFWIVGLLLAILGIVSLKFQ